MNWKIGLFIWWKGIVCLAIPSILIFLLGLPILCVALMVSWPAILFYAVWLWVCRQSGFSHTATLATLILIPAPISIVCAMQFYAHFIGEESTYHFTLYSFSFLGPLLFCIAGIFFCKKSIYSYLHPDEILHEFTID